MKNLKHSAIFLVIAACLCTEGVIATASVKCDDKAEKDTVTITIDNVEAFGEKSTFKISILEDNIPTERFNQTTKRVVETHQLWNELLQNHVSNNGIVNYRSFKTEHKKLRDYMYALSLFKSNEGFQSISREETLAFWINAYNALTIDLILRNYPLKSIKDIKEPWGQRLWKLGETWYNLNEIEHQILRKMDEPRIHFAIVCASVSCPKLLNEAYTAKNLEFQLTKATKDFLSEKERNIITPNAIQISKIFQWFAKDFKQNGGIIDFINQYTEVKISKNAKKSYKDYNWDLNE